VVTLPLLLGYVSLSAVPKKILVFGSNPVYPDDEYHFLFFGGVLNTHPEALYNMMGLAIQSRQDLWDRMIKSSSSSEFEESVKTAQDEQEKDEELTSVKTAQTEKKKDEKLVQMLEEAKSKGAGIDNIKDIILKEGPSCGLGEKLLLWVQELGTGPKEDTLRKVGRHHYTFISMPEDVSTSPTVDDLLMSELLHISRYPIAYIPCTVGEGQFLKLVQERGEGFDYIYTCPNTLFMNSLKVIEELVNVLNPGGKLYVSFENPDYPFILDHFKVCSSTATTATEVPFADKKATVRIKEVDYYTLAPPERQEIDDVVLWSSTQQEQRKPANPSDVVRHHFQGIVNEYVDETSKLLLIITREG
jgi:SAM-dependent methyltransferase